MVWFHILPAIKRPGKQHRFAGKLPGLILIHFLQYTAWNPCHMACRYSCGKTRPHRSVPLLSGMSISSVIPSILRQEVAVLFTYPHRLPSQLSGSMRLPPFFSFIRWHCGPHFCRLWQTGIYSSPPITRKFRRPEGLDKTRVLHPGPVSDATAAYPPGTVLLHPPTPSHKAHIIQVVVGGNKIITASPMENNRIPGSRRPAGTDTALFLHGSADAEGAWTLEIQSVQLPFYLFCNGRDHPNTARMPVHFRPPKPCGPKYVLAPALLQNTACSSKAPFHHTAVCLSPRNFLFRLPPAPVRKLLPHKRPDAPGIYRLSCRYPSLHFDSCFLDHPATGCSTLPYFYHTCTAPAPHMRPHEGQETDFLKFLKVSGCPEQNALCCLHPRCRPH